MKIKIIISLLILGIVGSFGYFILSKKSTPIVAEQPIEQNLPDTQQTQTSPPPVADNVSTQTQPSNTITVTNDWKTYSNDKYGFQFKYPLSFSFKLENEYEYKDGQLLYLYDSKQNPDYLEDIISVSLTNNLDNISVANYDDTLLLEYVPEIRKCIYHGYDKNYIQEEKINGYAHCYFNWEGEFGKTHFLIHPTKEIAFSIAADNDNDKSNIVKEILSTFKFTK